MAKTIGPLMSIAAHGSLGGALTYSKRKTVNQVRYQKKQTDIITTAREIQRGYFQTSVGWWNEMTATEQTGFDGYDERAT